MSMLGFDFKTQSFSFVNAYYLAKISELIYNPLSQISDVLSEEYGLTQYKPFEVNDTQAFLAANADMLVLAFRGTTSATDWITNVKFALSPADVGRVHYGFQEALGLVWDDLYDTICTWKDRDQTLWITGHSLGGALATLAVDRLTERRMEVSGLYTFGQPRVGDRQFADNFNRKMKDNTFRFVDDEDIVTKVPFPPAYRHIGTEYFFDHKGILHKGGSFWDWFRSASEGVYLRSLEEGSKYAIKNPGGIRDHSPIYYIKYLYQNLQEKGKNHFLDYINRI